MVSEQDKQMIKYKKGYWPQHRRTLITRGVHWAVSHYGLWDLTITSDRLRIVLTRFKSAYGDAYQDGDEYIIRLSDRYNDRLTLMTVFHEMTHVKQYEFDGLDLGTPSTFKGKAFDVDYWDAPWEVEARKAEKKMWRKWKKYLDTTAF